MSALPPSQMRAMRTTLAETGVPQGLLEQRWEALHEAAAQLAETADIGPEAYGDELASFPSMVSEATDWQRDMAYQGLEDIDAMMRPGLTALNTITARGADASVPALALWREFHHARSAVMALVQPQA